MREYQGYMNRTKSIKVAKYTIYALLLLLLYILQTVPGLFVLFETKPVWMVAAAVAIAMLEGEFVGGIYGAAAGLLCDMGGFSLFGFNGFFVSLCCILTGLLVIYLMYCNIWGCLLCVFITMLVCNGLEYVFTFGIWEYEAEWKLFTMKALPTVLYSTLITPIPYFLVRGIYNKFAAALK